MRLLAVCASSNAMYVHDEAKTTAHRLVGRDDVSSAIMATNQNTKSERMFIEFL